MEQKDKELLLKDLCARLTYGVKIQVNDKIESLQGINVLDNVAEYDCCLSSEIEEVKPYLFPLSDISEKQEHEFLSTCNGYCSYYWTEETFDWLNENHIDYRGLIEKGLAIDCTNLNIY